MLTDFKVFETMTERSGEAFFTFSNALLETCLRSFLSAFLYSSMNVLRMVTSPSFRSPFLGPVMFISWW
jgi:hypothetical protein